MKLIVTPCILIFLTATIAAQDSTIILKRFDEQMIHVYKNGYMKNGVYRKFLHLETDMRPGMPSFDYYKLNKKYEKRQTTFSLISVAGIVAYTVGVFSYSQNGSNVLLWSASAVTITALGLTISFESKAKKNLHLAIKTRNREILAGY